MLLELFLGVAVSAAHASFTDKDFHEEEDGNTKVQKMLVGDKTLIDGRLIHRTAIVLDEHGSVFVMSVVGAGGEALMRISKRRAVKDLFVYRGIPYILDNRGNLYAFDMSLLTSVLNKVPYMGMRALKALPVAVGMGLSLYLLGSADQAFLRILSTTPMDFNTTMFGTISAVYAIDMTYSAFFKSHRSIGWGGNFFRKRIAKGVMTVERSDQYDDYIVMYKRGWRTPTASVALSLLYPRAPQPIACAEYLTKLGLR